MKFFFKIFKGKDIFVLFIIICSYLLLTLQSYPLSNDDFGYRFHQETDQVITSLGELITSNIYGYLHVNGRFLAHIFIQFFLAWDLLSLFNIFCAGAFLLLICSIVHLVKRGENHHRNIIYVVFCLLLFWPLLASTCYGTVCLNINYLWSAAIYTFFLVVYFHIKDCQVNYPLWKNIVLFVFGLLCGSWQESFGIGIGGAICMYHLIYIRKTTKSTFYLIVGFGIGLCILLFAPGNFVRVEIENEGFIGLNQFIYQTIQLCKHNVFVDVWVILAVLSILIDVKKGSNFLFIKENWLYFSAALISFLFTLYTIAYGMMQGIWQLTILGVIDTILMLKFIQRYLPIILENNVVYYATIVSMCIFLGIIYGYRNVLKTEKKDLINEFCLHKNDTAYDGRLQYTIMHELPTYNEFIYDRVCDMYCSFYNEGTLQSLSNSFTKGQERWGTTLLPESRECIIANCSMKNLVSENVFLTPLHYYVVKIPKQNNYSHIHLVFSLEKNNPILRTIDKLRKKEYKENFSINTLPYIEDDEYIYAIKRLDWWHYHKMVIINSYCE